MDLVIVESPTKARTLGRFLGEGFQVEASYGHVRDLPEKKIGVKIDEKSRVYKFDPEYVVTKKQEERMAEIGKLAGKAEVVYLATDPDREGEAIAWHVESLLPAGAHKKVKRIVFHEITKRAIEDALSQPRKIDGQMVDAQQARRILDRLVGYKLSPLLWRKVRKGLSAGRVQSVAVRLVVEREREIEAFVPVEYWEMAARLKSGGGELTAAVVERAGEKLKVGRAEEAAEVERDLEKAMYLVAEVEKKETRRTPPAPFTTSTLQQAGASRFGWSAKKTMQVAQNLYEEGRITYHRTDSTNMAMDAVVEAAGFVKTKWGREFGLEKPRFYATKNKVAQEAHEAIRPTEVTVERLEGEKVNRDEQKLYELIWRRFVACQMSEAVMDNTKVKIKATSGGKEYGLEARGSVMLFEGWMKVYLHESGENGNTEKEAEGLLPEVGEGEKLGLVELIKQQKFTQPPARYNDASLIKTLEEMGIGRPSTYAPIISTIQDRQYVEKIEKRFKPTALGVAVNDFLVQHFPDVVSFEFTAKMEDDLDEIADGKKEWQPVLSEWYHPFEKTLVKAGEEATRVKVEVEKTGDKCPDCGEGDVVIRIGRFGRFLACSRYPECKYRANYVNKIGMPCPKCNGDVIVRRTRSGKSFYGCSNYPKCDFASWTKPVAAGEKKTGESSQDEVK